MSSPAVRLCPADRTRTQIMPEIEGSEGGTRPPCGRRHAVNRQSVGQHFYRERPQVCHYADALRARARAHRTGFSRSGKMRDHNRFTTSGVRPSLGFAAVVHYV